MRQVLAQAGKAFSEVSGLAYLTNKHSFSDPLHNIGSDRDFIDLNNNDHAFNDAVDSSDKDLNIYGDINGMVAQTDGFFKTVLEELSDNVLNINRVFHIRA